MKGRRTRLEGELGGGRTSTAVRKESETTLHKTLLGKIGAVLIGALLLTGLLVSPASATKASNHWNIKNGTTFTVNGWHCGTYVKSCSWTSSAQLKKGSRHYNAAWIQNRTELQAHGFRVSLKISKNPEATLTMKSKSLGEVRWKNYTSWISDNSGKMYPSWTTVYVSVKSCGSAKVNSKISISEKCVYAGAA